MLVKFTRFGISNFNLNWRTSSSNLDLMLFSGLRGKLLHQIGVAGLQPDERLLREEDGLLVGRQRPLQHDVLLRSRTRPAQLAPQEVRLGDSLHRQL